MAENPIRSDCMSTRGVDPSNNTLQPSFIVAVTTRAQKKKKQRRKSKQGCEVTMDDKDRDADLQAQRLQATLDNLTTELQSMRAFVPKITPFDGKNDSIQLWLADFDRFLTSTRTNSDVDRLNALISHLSGEAKQWFRVLPAASQQTYAALRTALRDKYSKTDFQKIAKKSRLFQLKQRADEPFTDFVHRVQQAASGLQLEESDILSICLQGANPQLQPFLVMAQVTTLDGLLKLPVIAESAMESNIINTNPHVFQVLTDKIDDLKASVDNTKPANRVRFKAPGIDTGLNKTYTEFDREFRRSRRTDDRSRSPGPRAPWTQSPAPDNRPKPMNPRMNNGGRSDIPRFSRTLYREPRMAESERRQDGWNRQPRTNYGTRPFQPSYNSTPRRLQTPDQCSKCGYSHNNRPCPAIGKNCSFCNGLNHFRSVCRRRQMMQPRF